MAVHKRQKVEEEKSSLLVCYLKLPFSKYLYHSHSTITPEVSADREKTWLLGASGTWKKGSFKQYFNKLLFRTYFTNFTIGRSNTLTRDIRVTTRGFTCGNTCKILQ